MSEIDDDARGLLATYTAQELIDIALARKDPEAAKALYASASLKEPFFVAAWAETSDVSGTAVDDLNEVMGWLREDKLFAQADRIRTIMGRIARSVHKRWRSYVVAPDIARNLARAYPNQLSLKESKKIEAEISNLLTEAHEQRLSAGKRENLLQAEVVRLTGELATARNNTLREIANEMRRHELDVTADIIFALIPQELKP